MDKCVNLTGELSVKLGRQVKFMGVDGVCAAESDSESHLVSSVLVDVMVSESCSIFKQLVN